MIENIHLILGIMQMQCICQGKKHGLYLREPIISKII